MNGSPGITDAVGLGILLAGLVYSPSVAAVVGPYIVIILASVIGASFAVRRRDKTTRLAAAWYFSRVAGRAVLLTSGVASWASGYYDGWSERALIAPVALAIGAIGDDWPALLQWFLKKTLAGIDLLRGGDKPS